MRKRCASCMRMRTNEDSMLMFCNAQKDNFFINQSSVISTVLLLVVELRP